MPAQRMQMKTPRLTEAHVGAAAELPAAAQSTHTRLPCAAAPPRNSGQNPHVTRVLADF
jgi:hypothetical protein